MNNIEQMKPTYDIDEELKEYKIIYGDRKYILSSELFCKILNYERSFKIHNINDDYPSYKINNKYIDFLEFSHGLKRENYYFKFINGNKYDIRSDNIIVEDINFINLIYSYNVIQHISYGVKVLEGRYSGQYKNPICKILNDKNEEAYLMLCNNDVLFTLCSVSYRNLKEYEKNNNYKTPIIWSSHSSGYIIGNNNLFIHHILNGCLYEKLSATQIRLTHIGGTGKTQIRLTYCENNSFDELLKPFNVIKHIYDGTRVKEGRYSGQIKNPICEILNEKNEEEYLMLCNRNKICKLCPRSYEIIREFEKKNNYETSIIWSYQESGYVLGNNNLFIHQVITGCYGNGKGTKVISVDHIDQNPLNNRYDNLRIATREEQQENSKGIKEGTKRERKHNARDLPEGITQDMMKKYVVYYKERKYKDKDIWREYFKVEKHPKLDKPWTGSKSSKVSILDKLKEANKIVEDLDNDTYEKKESEYPKYINKRYDKKRDNYFLCYERIVNKTKKVCKMVLPKEYDLEEQLNKFEERIRKNNPEYLTNIN
tara:strand:- start:2074 stop:3693 length:1620 start_codon:yes stop_codon:yes gene_type:complete